MLFSYIAVNLDEPNREACVMVYVQAGCNLLTRAFVGRHEAFCLGFRIGVIVPDIPNTKCRKGRFKLRQLTNGMPKFGQKT